MKAVLASNNKKKMVEMRAILGELGVEVLSQADVGVSIEPEENGQQVDAFLKRHPDFRLERAEESPMPRRIPLRIL